MLSAMPVLPASLASTSLLLAVALTIAWASFGRQRHTLLWAACFAIFFVSHGFSVARFFLPGASRLLEAFTLGAMIVSMSLLALGFRHRAGLRGTRPIWLPAAITAGAMLVLMALWPEARLYRIATHGYAAALLLVSATVLGADREEAHAAAAATRIVLIVAAAYTGVLAAMAVMVVPLGLLDRDTYRTFVLLGVPICQTAIGLFLLLMVGADLATRMQRLASTDPLTGVLNRRGLQEAAARLIAVSRRAGRALSVVVADLDRFKEVNDRYGHALGDIVLKRFAQHAVSTMRESDLIGRYGGEEFVMVLPDADARQAAEAVERLRSTLGIVVGDVSNPMDVTVSFGIAALHDRGDTMATLVARADAALYRSKIDGRDRVTLVEMGGDAEQRFVQNARAPRGDAPRAA